MRLRTGRAVSIGWVSACNRAMSRGKSIGGKPAEACAILNDFLRRAPREPFPALAIALVYIGLAEKDKAFEWLEKAIEQRDLDVTLKWDSPYEPLRSDVRYTALLRQMKLM